MHLGQLAPFDQKGLLSTPWGVLTCLGHGLHPSPQAFPGLSQLVLVGDPKQLPATVISQLAADKGYARSLFQRLQSCGVPVSLLDTQYR